MEKQELKINVPIPEGMVLKSVRSEIKDGTVVVIPEYEENPKYKDGDILALLDGSIFIYNSDNSKLADSCGNNYYLAIATYDSLFAKKGFRIDSYWGYNNEIRGLATEEEKQKLFDVLAKNGYKWNAETKELEKVLPRVPKGEKFFAFNGFLEVFKREEERDFLCDCYYKAGNYFLTEEEAKRAADKAKEAIKR
ncbi:MAG: hypothetical protein SPG69_07865 [Bacteroides pyogenes]|uniref:hypothetical protein n=1 Tax=Bacteroides pyogenes TaxID=310300 RepID=UPI002A909DA5|nr:hypothetical protein [Bacteroides pyogenes]MDY5353926.1 hypothetical protein [Bacteroides pyogenes]